MKEIQDLTLEVGEFIRQHMKATGLAKHFILVLVDTDGDNVQSGMTSSCIDPAAIADLLVDIGNGMKAELDKVVFLQAPNINKQ